MQILQLQTHFLFQRLTEGIVRQNNRVLSHIALGIDIGLAELLFSDGNIHVLVGVQNEFAPMAASRVEGSTIVENVAANSSWMNKAVSRHRYNR